MRSYSALLVLETVFDSVEPSNDAFGSLVSSVFTPTLRVVEDDCGTLLGEQLDVNFEAEGRIELATGLPITRTRITQLLSQGRYTTAVRNLQTCTSEGGVCAKCYAASRPLEAAPSVGGYVTVKPVYDRSSEVLYTPSATSALTLGTHSDSYDTLLVYLNGSLLPSSGYAAEGTTLRLVEPVPANTYIVARYVTETRVPYMLWLANSYSGSLLGVRPLPGPPLPVRSLLLQESLDEAVIDSVLDETKKMDSIPQNMLEYLGQINDKLEKSLFLIALRSIYAHVSN